MDAITSTDWILLAILLASLVLGAWRGLVYEVMSVIGWLAAFVLAQWFAADVAARLPMQSAGDSLRYAAGFVLVFIASVFVAGLISALLRKMITVIGLQVGVLFTGAILTETIFSWPGVGKWLIESISRRDYPALQGGVEYFTAERVALAPDCLVGQPSRRTAAGGGDCGYDPGNALASGQCASGIRHGALCIPQDVTGRTERRASPAICPACCGGRSGQ